MKKKLEEFKNMNDANMSGELSELLNNYFKCFLSFKEQNEEISNNENIFIEYEKYGISNFI